MATSATSCQFGAPDRGPTFRSWTIIGDNLSTSMMGKTGTGLVVYGANRDPSGLSQIEGFKIFTRDFDPSTTANTTLMRWNFPIRIGQARVLPGGVALSDPDGMNFIPTQVAEQVANERELTELRDDWSHTMLREQKYNPGQIDAQWTPATIDEFNRWAAAKVPSCG